VGRLGKPRAIAMLPRLHLCQSVQQGPTAAVQPGADELRSDPDRCIHLPSATASLELLYQLRPPADLQPVNVMC
jgi:hypothetical protein